MKQDHIFTRLQTTIADQLGERTSEVTRTSHFRRDLHCDSLDAVEVVMAIEAEFDIDIPDEYAEGIETVGDVEKWLTAKLGGAA